MKCINNDFYVSNVHDGGGAKWLPPTSFSTVTSTNVGISPKNLMEMALNVRMSFCKHKRRA